MSAKIESVSLLFCDAEMNPLPMDENSNGFLARFKPSPLGSTGEIFLKVTCRFKPAKLTELRYMVKLVNRAHYRIIGGDEETITYFRNADSEKAVFLPFNIKNIVALKKALPADMKLFVRDASPSPPNEPQRVIRIKGFN